jgi:hypothetical protein
MELGVVTATASRIGAATDLARPAVERVPISIRLALPLVEAQRPASAATSELARDLRAVAGTRDSVTLLLPAGRPSDSTAARLDTGRQQFPISAALRDALLAAAASQSGRAGSAAPASTADAGAARAWAIGAQTTAAAALALGAAGIARQVTREATIEEPRARVRFSQPLLAAVGAAQPVQAIADRLRERMERSGLFYEAHVAQWVRGERAEDALRQELLAALGLAGREPGAQPGAGERVAAQLEVLQRQVVSLQGPAWAGQQVQIDIARERPSADDGRGGAADSDHAVFVATLRMSPPGLGPIEVRLRLAGDSVATTVRAESPQRLRPELDALSAQLAARGLAPVLVQAVETEGRSQ